jgi:hypothetical protein
MSRTWAVVETSTGKVVSTMNMNSQDLTDGGDYLDNTHFVKDITGESNTRLWPSTKYWANDQWNDLPTSPGKYYSWNGSSWALDSTRLFEEIRRERDRLLSECDWTQGSDSPLSDSDKTSWATYRQSLRDVPANNSSVTDYADVTWPTEP